MIAPAGGVTATNYMDHAGAGRALSEILNPLQQDLAITRDVLLGGSDQATAVAQRANPGSGPVVSAARWPDGSTGPDEGEEQDHGQRTHRVQDGEHHRHRVGDAQPAERVGPDLGDAARAKIGATVSEALDQQTGLSLQDRSVEYHKRSAMYSSDVGAQGQAVNQISGIATETNANMVRAIRG